MLPLNTNYNDTLCVPWQVCVLRVMYDWLGAAQSLRVEWRSATTTSMAQCAMTSGMTMMPWWSAGSWDTQVIKYLFPIYSS